MKNQEPNLENCYNCIHFSVRELKNGDVKTCCEVSSLKVGDNICLRYKKELDDVESEENEDFFLIKDNCYTELTPEEIDENGVGRTLTCIGFRPLPDDICAQLSKKYQLYK